MAKLLPRLEHALLRSLLSLPPAVVRRLAGRPVLREGQELSADTQLILRLSELSRRPGMETLPIATDGRATYVRESIVVGGVRRPIGETRDLRVPAPGGPVRARLYVPRDAGGTPPLLVYLHGGGMLYGDLETHDPACRFLAEESGCLILSLEYRLAPEHPYPAGLDDAWAGYRWAVQHAAELGADPQRIGVGGDSAGGMLSAVVALRAAREGVRCDMQLLIYPATDMTGSSASRTAFDEGFVLTRQFMDLADRHYLGATDRTDPEVSVLYADVPDGLAPAVVVTAGYDPLRDEGEAYARKLAAAGVTVELRRFPGMIHGFLHAVGVGRDARACVAEVAALLKAALPA